jgi:phosphatidylserine decarboxylase
MIAICIVVAVIGAIVHPAIFAVGIAATLFTLFFFRDPERKVAAGQDQIIAPADGKVLSIDEVEEKEFIGGPCKRVSIFLSIFDVHINRAPVGGTVEMLRYNRGTFAFANTDDASLNNESNLIGIDAGGSKIAVKQIAGAVARRIVCHCSLEQTVLPGDRIGMIRFGSRTELYIPSDCEIFVSVGQKVKGGLTLIGAYNGPVAKKA